MMSTGTTSTGNITAGNTSNMSHVSNKICPWPAAFLIREFGTAIFIDQIANFHWKTNGTINYCLEPLKARAISADR